MEDNYEPGSFCEIMGDTPKNRIIEELWTIQGSDFCVADLAEDLELSRPTVYEFVKEYEKKGIIVPSRIVGKTQLYKIDKNNVRTKAMLKSVWECVKIMGEDFAQKELLRQPQKQMAVAEQKTKYKKNIQAQKSKLTKEDIDEFDKLIKKLANKRFNA